MKKEQNYVIYDKTDIKIFILFLLDNVNYPIDYTTVENIVTDNGYVAPFDFAECFSELSEHGHVVDDTVDGVRYYAISETGRAVVAELSDTILDSLKKAGALSAAKYLSFEKSGARVVADVTEREDKKFDLSCSVINRSGMVFSISICVAVRAQAEAMKEKFIREPEKIYRSAMSALTGEFDYLIG